VGSEQGRNQKTIKIKIRAERLGTNAGAAKASGGTGKKPNWFIMFYNV